MNSNVCIFFMLIALLGACRKEANNSDLSNSDKSVEASLFDSDSRTEALENYVQFLNSNLSDEERHQMRDRKFKGAYDYAYAELDWTALAERTFSQKIDEGLQDEGNQIFARLGVYSRDARGGMMRTSLIRAVKQEPMKVREQALQHRQYWEKNEGIRPPEIIECPLCGEVMRLMSMGNGYDRKNPDLWTFTGDCPNEHSYMYDQVNGWHSYHNYEKIKVKGPHKMQSNP